MNRIAQIENLTRLWHESTQRGDDGSCIDENTECHRLSRNGIFFHELTYEELMAAIGYVTSTLLLPNLNSLTTTDHSHLIAWCQQIILDRDHCSDRPLEHRHYHKMSEICTRFELLDFYNKGDTGHSIEWLAITSERGMILACIAFPLLEAALKISCFDFVTIKGEIKKDFEISLIDRNDTEYKQKFKVGGKCISSLKVLLQLYHELVAPAPAKNAISIIKNSLAKLHPGKEPFNLIYEWRNSTLHGADSFSTISGTLLGLAFIVEISKEEHRYEELRKQTIEGCKFKSTNQNPMWYIYRHPL